jgi:hypothetical protein
MMFLGVAAVCQAHKVEMSELDCADFSGSDLTFVSAGFLMPNNLRSSACVLSEE